MSADDTIQIDPEAPAEVPTVPVPEWASETVLSSVDHAPVRPFTTVSENGTVTVNN